jgi:hypothetical protein
MHGGNDVFSLDHQSQVLANERDGPFDHPVFRDPTGAVFRHAELSAQNSQVDIFKAMRIFQAGGALRKGSKLGTIGYDPFGLGVLLLKIFTISSNPATI